MRISDWSSDVCSSDLGILAGHAALSRASGELGAAGILNFQRDFPNAEGWGGTLNLTAELWTRNFAAPGGRSIDIPFKQRIGASYIQSLGETFNASIDAKPSKTIDHGHYPLSISGSFGSPLIHDIHLTDLLVLPAINVIV